MKVLVGVKRVIDYAAKVRVASNKRGVELTNVKMSMNPFCEIALEEAIRLKEKGAASEVVVVSVGPKGAQEQIRTALALGADRGLHLTTDLRLDQELQPLAVAKLFKAVVEREGDVGLVLLGKQSIDSDCGQVGPMLAGLLDWSQATFASKIDLCSGDNATFTVERETDTGTEVLECSKPAVITADLRLNEPRYATLPNIMKAKKKKIEALEAAGLGVDLEPRLQILEVNEPPPRKAGIVVGSVDELVEKLKNEAAVI
mmetsp:Transcript_12018/g.18096  ORF Transcript_12018/g.18096 Transcript_12018/m.18096 type:complete len:258 (-) Transcript_12018:111-884(-)|eukprot:CAMPEP_0172599042 /NCGR_PEP_ID=MMETSP1068-20121228/19142_1 /TAXON_ID=35684 /ORGANISM="Pseudopedinella elastica, Strain CCMP716" /LENGTH=257 /DNA_ID=CAMNT_0013399171 /DNA_START=78 /DNA_END=851 /DNA_ORIENTATION=-